jgi:hypothetical protein
MRRDGQSRWVNQEKMKDPDEKRRAVIIEENDEG